MSCKADRRALCGISFIEYMKIYVAIFQIMWYNIAYDKIMRYTFLIFHNFIRKADYHGL